MRRRRRSRIVVTLHWHLHHKSKFIAGSYVAVAVVLKPVKVGRCAAASGQRSALFPTMELQTPRLILRPFRDDDIARLAQLMANPDFMRFSLGPYTREQTRGALDKFLSWEKAGLPSPYAVVLGERTAVHGPCCCAHHSAGQEQAALRYGVH